VEINFEEPSQNIGMPDRQGSGASAKSKVARIAGASFVLLSLGIATGGIAGAATTKSAGSPAGALQERHAVSPHDDACMT